MTEQQSIQDHYPEPCAFCAIASAYPPRHTSSSPLSDDYQGSRHQLPLSLLDCIPSDASEDTDPTRVEPNAYVILSSPEVIAFLDILPMTRGHLLLATRRHRPTLRAVDGVVDGREIGFWLPLVSRAVVKVTGTTDFNVVQNNGVRAAQVVPHVHFHIIPRPESKPQLQNKSWTMFGRGQRDELDDDEASELAEQLRGALREEVEALMAAGAEVETEAETEAQTETGTEVEVGEVSNVSRSSRDRDRGVAKVKL